jgi:DNA-binding HxlR family transcriptional regulator
MSAAPLHASNAVDPDDLTPACPLELAICVIGGKWKMLVIRALFARMPQRYNELLKSVSNISAKELTRNLRELEGAGLVLKVRSGANAKSVYAYELTELGLALRSAFRSLGEFGALLEGARGRR